MSTHGQGADGAACLCEGGEIRLEISSNLLRLWGIVQEYNSTRYAVAIQRAPLEVLENEVFLRVK